MAIMNYEFIIKSLTDELEKNGDNANVLKERGRLRMLSGDHDGAIADLKRAVALDPTLLNDISGEFNNKK